jgi:hypothetical protein
MMMIAEDGHHQMFNLNLGGLTRILNPTNDFGGSHKIFQCTTWIAIMYLGVMYVLVWNGVVPIVTINILQNVGVVHQSLLTRPMNSLLLH